MVTAERTASTTESQPERAQSQVAERIHPLRIQLPAEWELTDERFLEFCALNEEWRIEADGEGGLLIMPPPGPLSSERSGRLYSQTLMWSDKHGQGRTFESSAMFELPNGDRRMPDAAWISDERLAGIDENDEGVWETCPDFVVEVRSKSDKPEPLQEKMEMWISQGARLGWLVDPYEEAVWLYRPEQEPQRVERPESLTATEIADDLTIDFTRIWPQQDPTPETS